MLVGWGDKDPWEPIDLGRAYAQFDTVEDFVVLPNVGHCPQVFLYLLCIEFLWKMIFLKLLLCKHTKKMDFGKWHLSEFTSFSKLNCFLAI